MNERLSIIVPDTFSFYYYRCSEYDVTYLIKKSNDAYAQVYRYFNDETAFVLSDLIVHKDSRRKGIGTELQIIRENIAKELGGEVINLWLDVGYEQWKREWYERRGYKYSSEEDGVIWLSKDL